MSNATTATHKVPFGQKVAFGLGMLANQMFPAALGIFMVVLVQDLGFPGWMWGILFFLPRVFDSITDPIMGFITDNTRSVWGRRRQYVFSGAIIMGISFVIMWQLHRENGVNYNFIYFLLWSFMFYLGLTIFSVPYVAMGYEMSDDFHERTNIMAVAQWIGQWAWVIAPWFWVVMYDPSWFENADTATRTLSVWVGISCMILAMIPAIFIKQKSTKEDDSLIPLSIKNIGGGLKEILNGFVEAFKMVPFRRLCIATFLIFNAFNTVAAFSFFIIVYHMFNGDAGAAGIWPTLFGSLGALVTTFAVIPTVAWMSKKMGKKNAFMLSQGISIIGYLAFWFLFVPGKPFMFIFALPFFSFGIGSLFTLMMSMTADVCDLDELNTGKRREGIFGAIYWWMVKFGFAIAGLLSGAIMTLVGFVPNAAVQPEGAVEGLRLFFSGVPIFGTVIAMLVMRTYDVTEEKAHEIRAAIEKKKATKKGSSAYMPGKLLVLKEKGFDLNASYGMEFKGKTTADIKALFSKTLKDGLHGLCFSPYVEGQETGDILSESQIRRRMDIIMPYTRWIRSFSCTEGNELIPKIAHDKGLKTLVGVWISNDRERNEREIKALVKLANEGLVDIAAVGNEVLLRNELPEQELIQYIKKVKALLPSHIPVGYVDAYFHFLEKPALADACDVILINCYPFWEGANNDHALLYMQHMYDLTKLVAQGKKIVITETGWPSKGQAVQEAQPSAENAMKYFINAQQWAKSENIELFYFSSFDESWKIYQEGVVGTQWGLWDKNEKQKYV
ncbi:MAG: MFS transporter [Lewinellaceae bacterium]|nr:MFS transporter [Lewinellaceae bacterium]